MNKKASYVLLILLALQVFSLNRIINLQSDLIYTKNQLTALASDHSSQIQSIYSNIDEMLKRQSSIIDSYDYSIGYFDSESMSVPVTFSVTPKETKADTLATLYTSDQSIPMNKKGTTFDGTAQLNIFDSIEVKVVIADNGIEKTEKIDVWENLRERVLPTIFPRFEGQSGSEFKIKPDEMAGEYHRKGHLSLEVKSVPGNQIKNANLVVDVDGLVVSQKPINIDDGWTDIDESLTLLAGQTLTMSVVATDNFGLNYKSIIDRLALDDQGKVVRDMKLWSWLGEVIITDQRGKVLFAPTYLEQKD